MLGKIMKYDFKALCRYLLPIYAILVGSAVALRLCIEITDATDGSLLGAILVLAFGLAFGLSALATLFSAFIIIIIHFYKSLLTDQGYFYLSLPVSYDAHLVSKILMGAVFMILSCVAFFVSLLPFMIGNVELPAILSGFKAFFEGIARIMEYENGALCFILFTFIVLFGFQIKVYFSIILGQLWQKHRILGAFLAYLGIGMVVRILGSILSVNTISTFRLITNPDSLFNKATGWILMLLIFNVLIYILEYFFTRLIMKHKLNLE